MDFSALCTNCFKLKGGTTVCPYCGQTGAPAPEEAYHLYPGTILNGRYLIGKVLGSGGFGVIYMSLDLKLSRIVAIKEFFPTSLVSRVPGELNVSIFSGEKVNEYNRGIARFLDEARNMAMFGNNSHIVNVLEFFTENRTAYIVMEYLDGETLEQMTKNNGGRLNYEQALPIIKSVLESLSILHSHNIFHRDITPKNIMITRNNQIKLIDFGNAKFGNEVEELYSKAVTGGYAPPEQYAEKRAHGAFTDIYAVGATFYKTIVGQKPLDSTDRQNNDTLKKPSELINNLPRHIDVAIMTALALKPEQRFQSTDEMLKALVDENTNSKYPEEKEHTRFVKRNAVVVSALAALVAIIIAVLVLTQQSDALFKPMKNVIARKEYIELYLPYSSSEEQTELKNDFEKISKDFNKFSKNNYGKNISVNAHLIPIKSYAQEISKSKGTSSEACLFRTDIDEINTINKANLENLVQNISGKYEFYDRYKELYGPVYKELPMGFYVYMMYIKDYNDYGIEEISSWRQFSNDVSEKNLIVFSETAAPILHKSLKEDKASLDLASDILFRTMQNGKLPDVSSAVSTFRGNVDVLIGTSKDSYVIKENTDLNMSVNAQNVIGLGDQWYGRFDWIWSVSDDVSDSKRDASILFLRYCMDETAQYDLCSTDSAVETILSLNPKVLKSQMENNYIDKIPQNTEKIILLSNDSEDIAFAENFIKQGESNNIKESIRTFAKRYFK